jgi:4-hydroxy-2-oxoglutarate aldolase
VDLNGIFPAIPTPFVDDAIDFRAARANAARWMQTGLRGMLVLGSNGEAPLIDADEATRLIAAVREETPRDRVLIAGVNCQSTRQAIEGARAAAAAGADLALVITPFYFKSQMSGEALIRHFTAVADASPVPVLLYNVPPTTGVAIPVAAVETLAAHPNIAGMKDSSGDVGYTAEAIGRVASAAAAASAASASAGASSSGSASSGASRFDIVVGVAPNLLASLSVGARGAIVAVASVFPELCVELHALVRAGRADAALAIQRAITPLARAVTTTYGPAGLKIAVEANGYIGGPPRSPLGPLAAAQIAEIRTLVERLRSWAEAQPQTSAPDRALEGASR